MLAVVPFYAATLGLFFLVLSTRGILVSRGDEGAFGASPGSDLERSVRVDANFSAYTPIALLLPGMTKLRNADSLWLHTGSILPFARPLSHALGVSPRRGDDFCGIVGMNGFLSAILVAIILIAMSWPH